MEGVARLMEAAEGLTVTFHRAIDVVREPQEAPESLIELGVDRVVTFGGAVLMA